MFAHTRFRHYLRLSSSLLWRETRIALTPIPKPDCWLFVVGCYNSGTTLLAELLGRHPEIGSMPEEGQFLTDQFANDYELGLPRMWVDREDLFRIAPDDLEADPKRLMKEWAMRMNRRNARVLVEKSPPNGARTRWLQAHFPNSKFVIIVRNGYAVAEGIRRKAEPNHLQNGWDIEKSAHQWARSNQVLLEDAKHLTAAHWLTYEDFSANPDQALTNIATFAGLPDHNWDLNGQQFAIHERSESIRDMNPESLARLKPQEIDTIRSVAGDMLDHFNYPTPNTNTDLAAQTATY